MKFGLIFLRVCRQKMAEIGIHHTKICLNVCEPKNLDINRAFRSLTTHKRRFMPWTTYRLFGAAAVTSEMRIGTGVLLVPLYAPLNLQKILPYWTTCQTVGSFGVFWICRRRIRSPPNTSFRESFSFRRGTGLNDNSLDQRRI